MTSRKEVTEKLTTAATYYWTKKLYSNYTEIGIRSKKYGSLRADVISFNMKKDLVITEVKSCWADFNTDHKWHNYLQYCNRFYFCFPESLWDSPKRDKILEAITMHGNTAGVMVLCQQKGKLKVVKNAKKVDVPNKLKRWIFIKLAWSGGQSRKTIKRIRKIFL